ncbi:cytochrome C [Desulfosporosinus fructosivorans]|uniref:Cytochrome C n=1 Tax=Desulfosporosinus fructosivorans TaxID=2018669 RepID=A0A4Z0RBC9_9FIRM|nr:cytochrome C [Desulfosporosinus fructosivorans]TGE39625.1 cytochrome C [Desulfosporosinus fructosivorans]
MAQLTKNQMADYQQFCHDRNNGRGLTLDGLRFICEANNYDAEAIGKHFLDVLPKVCPKESYQ